MDKCASLFSLSLAEQIFRFLNIKTIQNDTVEINLPGSSVGEGLLTTAMRLSSLVCSILMASLAPES